ncbi:hypothetical protein [Labrys monachus]|jgi:hypothetical protein|uniref:Uncharacterized protein n=1 Tax=Labrys monachus TaxID=217067 RepID=A0ABU0FB20_9HYPH|nr:hypothetical protein [Labrys monachus]MDQ0391263.1 hypothetical protein [Labrys monachus]
MPRNEIAAIIGLIVAIWYVLAGPGRSLGLPRNPRGLAMVLVVFLVTFAIVWIVLRLLNY